jgi:aryl-alcohol dehydrogenase-like predicted oxidoreductase
MRSTEIGGEWFSVVGLGGYELEDDPDWPGAREVLLAAIEGDIDWIDTAEEYWDRKNEPVIAAALADVGRSMKLSSKVAPLPDGTGYEPKQIREACEGSLERLGVDHLDMFLMHYPGETNDGLEESWGAMRALVDDGLTRLVGLSNFERPEVERCLAVGPVAVLQEGCPDRPPRDASSRAGASKAHRVVTYEPLGNGMLPARSRPRPVRAVVPDYMSGRSKCCFSGRFERSEAVVEGCGVANGRLLAPQSRCLEPAQGRQHDAHAQPACAFQRRAADVVLSPDDLAALDALIPLGPTHAG